jgi:hypothetical protein
MSDITLAAYRGWLLKWMPTEEANKVINAKQQVESDLAAQKQLVRDMDYELGETRREAKIWYEESKKMTANFGWAKNAAERMKIQRNVAREDLNKIKKELEQLRDKRRETEEEFGLYGTPVTLELHARNLDSLLELERADSIKAQELLVEILVETADTLAFAENCYRTEDCPCSVCSGLFARIEEFKNKNEETNVEETKR